MMVIRFSRVSRLSGKWGHSTELPDTLILGKTEAHQLPTIAYGDTPSALWPFGVLPSISFRV